ncbi:MAG: sulfotransferase [Pseudobdellovibrionaceae bacterium]
MQTPVLEYLKVLKSYSPDLRYIPRAGLYFFKFAFFEPFRILENIIYGKEIRAHKVHASPIFILGYYRSGTTHLQELLLQDSRFAYLNFFQCIFPSAFILTEKFFKVFFTAFASAIRFHHPAHNIPFHFDLPAEEDVALVSAGYRHASNWGQIFPRHFREFFNKTVFFESADPSFENSFAEEMKSLMRRVSYANAGKRLLLKSPPHTARIAHLYKTFPKAKFIFIHRDLYQTYKSNQKLWNSFRGQCLQNFTEAQANSEILWSMNKSFEIYNRDKFQVPKNSLIEVSYEDLQARPIEVMAKIYSQLQIEGYSTLKPKFEAYVEQCHGSNVDNYKYTTDDFVSVEKKCARWLQLWSYARPGARSAARSKSSKEVSL